MFCPSCNTRNQPYNNYCYYCGYKLKDNDKIHSNDLKDRDTNLVFEDNQKNQGDQFIDEDPIDSIATIDDLTDISSIDTTDNIDRMYDYFFEGDDLLNIDDQLLLDQTSELNLTTQMPLRRYKKDKSAYKRKKTINKLLTIFFLIALAILATFVGMRRFGNRVSHTPMWTIYCCIFFC